MSSNDSDTLEAPAREASKEPQNKNLGRFEKGSAGRPKGKPNKLTTELRDAILEAANRAGGAYGLIGYLEHQANENPVAFLALLGKILPPQTAQVNVTFDIAERLGQARERAFGRVIEHDALSAHSTNKELHHVRGYAPSAPECDDPRGKQHQQVVNKLATLRQPSSQARTHSQTGSNGHAEPEGVAGPPSRDGAE